MTIYKPPLEWWISLLVLHSLIREGLRSLIRAGWIFKLELKKDAADNPGN